MACLDDEVIDELREILGDDLSMIAEAFVSQYHELLPALSAAQDAADWPEVARLAHLLKGSAGNLGVRALATALLDLERAAGDTQASAARQALARVSEQGPLCIAELAERGCLAEP